MKYTLKSFSQDVNLSSPDASQHFLVFEREDGTEFRIPVPQETIISLTKNTLAYEARKPKKELSDEDVQAAAEEVEDELRDESEEAAEAFKEDDDGEEYDPLRDPEYLASLEPDEGVGIFAVSPEIMRRAAAARKPASEEEIPSL